MAEAVACKVEFTGAVLDAAKWGGRLVTYDVSTGTDGGVTGLKRRVIAGFEHLATLVNLQSFESCIRRWRFEGRGDYTIALIGGTVVGDYWIIEVRADRRQFRLNVPRH
jgi:hypothetical protein